MKCMALWRAHQPPRARSRSNRPSLIILIWRLCTMPRPRLARALIVVDHDAAIRKQSKSRQNEYFAPVIVYARIV
jgi:hypothetical protein